MEDIVDVILLEMILSYKVIDCLMLRVVSTDETMRKKKKNHRLVPLFSPHHIRLPRTDCERLLQGIRRGLESQRNES
jgi:hypothetical protein